MSHAMLPLLIAAVSLGAPGDLPIAGKVVSNSGAPIPGARVYLETGRGADLVETVADAQGRFQFDEGLVGLVGVFAIADGYAWGGKSVRLVVDGNAGDTVITLAQPSSVGGSVVDMRNKPIAGAYITSVLIQGANQVGIPLEKLALSGYSLPTSDEKGRFTVPNMPQDGTVGLKVDHGDYAQGTQTGIQAGSNNAKVQLSSGILLQGTVEARGSGKPVANATIVITNAQPPNESLVARTDMTGKFTTRVKPGYYVCQSASMDLRSPSAEKITVDGSKPVVEVTIRVSGTALLRGEVRDAVTEQPVAGARIRLSAFGTPAAVTRTGPTGRYELAAVEGENVVQVLEVPGYLTPERAAIRVNAAQGQEVDLMTFWLRPMPDYRVQVLDEEGVPLSGATLRLLRPEQYRYHRADGEGVATFDVAQIPPDGRIIGIAEHPYKSAAALFAIPSDQAETAQVQLLPTARIKGKVVNSRQKGVEGALVTALFQDRDESAPVVLWLAYSNAEGEIAWDSVIPYVPAVAVATTHDTLEGRSMLFNLGSGESRDIGQIVVKEGTGREGLTGQRLDWAALPHLGGPPVEDGAGRPAVVMYTPAAEAPLVIDALEHLASLFGAQSLLAAVVVETDYQPIDAGVPVLQGNAPGPATTYLIDAKGRVALETAGMPMINSVRRLIPGAE